MSRLLAASLLGAWIGSTLLLSEMRWFRRLPLADRIAPFVGRGRTRTAGPRHQRSFTAALMPLTTSIGSQLARLFGVGEDLQLRLERVGDPATVTEFRSRQVGGALGGLAAGAAITVAASAPLPLVLGGSLGSSLLVFLGIEQSLARRSERHQHHLFLELPVVAEQLGMLLSSGYSLTGAVARLAERGSGATARDLRRVTARIAQGLSPEAALREWAQVASIDEVHQLVSILVLRHDAGDLGSLISQEARSMRRESQRRLLERIERRNEQVWIPVTVATLVPGVIFLAIPFVDALHSFGAL